MIRIVALALLTVFAVSSPATDVFAVKKPARAVVCDTSEDCPSGSRCKRSSPKRPGTCVGTRSPKRG
jgi:hypothetical protein